uniref:Diacylglycerol O-acyltransferase n=1 Tax=Hordeum vulgare subsp. vulgare TaxID=112509 RepID=A0A8I6YFE4_HORVV
MDAANTMRKRPLSVRTRHSGAASAMAEDGESLGEPVSPSSRLVEEYYIIVIIGFAAPVNQSTGGTAIGAKIASSPRFQSIRATDKDGTLRWVRTTVDLDYHVIYPKLDTVDVEVNPDLAVEDYVASLSTKPMDHSRPLWEFHILDFPTSEATATAVMRVHHSLSDGISLLMLLLYCAQSAADPSKPPVLPPLPARTGALYVQPRPPLSVGSLAFAMWLWSFVLLAWYTMWDAASFVCTILFWKDTHTLFTRTDNTNRRQKRIVHRGLSLDDVKFIKDAMNCECVSMIQSGKGNDVKWGNQLGFIILPVQIAMHRDPLDYVRKAKNTTGRKKSSLEVAFIHVVAEVFFKVFGRKAGAYIIHRLFSNTTMMLSNMIGPAEQVELCGHPVVFIAPSQYGLPQAINVNFKSYVNIVRVVLAMDEAQFPHGHELLDDFVDSLRRIKDAADKLGKHERKA